MDGILRPLGGKMLIRGRLRATPSCQGDVGTGGPGMEATRLPRAHPELRSFGFLRHCLAPNQELKLGLTFHAGPVLLGLPACQRCANIPLMAQPTSAVASGTMEGAGGGNEDFKALLK